MAKIGVEGALQNVAQALQARGHQVVELKQESDVNGCDCCVITGLDSNIMGIQNTVIQGSVIEANGLSADEVCEQVESKIQ
ncbi:MAG TPA: YkuS family protein [Chondromyces sp.]|nr:YkuS family protein [Chondromyces sp.]